MGQKMTTNRHKLPKGEEVSRNRFEFETIIGKGGFGKVWKVKDRKEKQVYALKEMAKVRVIDKKSERSIKYERELLSRLKNPFIVNMYYAFQDYDNLYLVMDLLTGGDLRYHICRHRKMNEEQTRFFISCIVLGLEYIHSKNVLHRDIKPENLVLDDKGYVRITDFGIAKVFNNNNSSETSGTPGYMSPEVMKGLNHTIAVDYFALGVMGYEFMLGHRPYVGKSRKEIKEQMMAKQAQINLNEVPNGWSEEAVDFFNKLLQRKPELRLGYKGAKEVKNHPWLKYYPWDEIKNKTFIAPFIPEKRDNFDKKYCNSIDKIGVDTQTRYEEYHLNQKYDRLFENFTYYPILDSQPNDNNNLNENKQKLIKHTYSKSNNYNSRGYYYSLSKPNKQKINQKVVSSNKTNNVNKANKHLNSPLSSENEEYMNTFRKNVDKPQLTGGKLSKKATSQSTYNFRNYPVRKSVNLSNIDHLYYNINYLSSNNRTITPTCNNKSTDKGVTTINKLLNDPIKKRSNSKSACSNHIKQTILKDNDKLLTKTKNTLHRSSSTYGYISINPIITNKKKKKSNDNNTSISIKVIENSHKTKKTNCSHNNIPHSSKPSGQFRLPSSHQKNQSAVQIINQSNCMLNNYKMSTSCNSTGSSNVSNHNNVKHVGSK